MDRNESFYLSGGRSNRSGDTMITVLDYIINDITMTEATKQTWQEKEDARKKERLAVCKLPIFEKWLATVLISTYHSTRKDNKKDVYLYRLWYYDFDPDRSEFGTSKDILDFQMHPNLFRDSYDKYIAPKAGDWKRGVMTHSMNWYRTWRGDYLESWLSGQPELIGENMVPLTTVFPDELPSELLGFLRDIFYGLFKKTYQSKIDEQDRLIEEELAECKKKQMVDLISNALKFYHSNSPDDTSFQQIQEAKDKVMELFYPPHIYDDYYDE